LEEGRLAAADSEPPRRLRAGKISTRRPLWSVGGGRSPRAAWRFPGEPVWGVRLEVMSVLYWH
jgi:hypothetical protein